jgi:phage terminase small subunit
MSKLTMKQQTFADYYIEIGNASEAYAKAGYKIKSDATARANASRLLTNDNVKKYIANRMEIIEDSKILKQTEILKLLSSAAKREEKESIVVTIKKRVSKWVDGKKQTIEEEVPKVVEIPAKISDANKARELLGRYYAMWTDRQEVEGTVSIVDDIPKKDDKS